MKFVALLLLLSLISACSFGSKKLEQSVSESDGQFVGGEGAPLIYYKDGKHIVIKSCNNAGNFDVTNPKIAREKCVGKENRVTPELFRQILQKIIAQKAAEKTKAETAAASAGAAPAAGGAPAPAPGGKSAAEKLEEARIEKALQFIESYSDDDMGLKDLKATSVKGLFNQKLKTQLDKALDTVVNDTVASSKQASADPDNILMSVLKELDPNKKKPCGLIGDISERIENCATTPGSSLNEWQLVVRTKSNTEIWRDKRSGLIWGEKLSDTYNHIDAVGQCSIDREENGNLDASEFKLPSIAEFEQSNLSSDGNPLIQKSFKFWSSSSEGPEVWVYNGANGKKELVSRSMITKSKDGGEFVAQQKLYTRCVARIK